MRLINVSTREVEEFHGKVPPYAILSHTWGDDEVMLHEMQAIARHRRPQRQTKPATQVVQTTDSADAMRLMLLANMLMAFRGEASRFGPSRSFPALTTSGYESDSSSDDGRSHRTITPSSSPHPLEQKAGYSKIAYACGQAEKDGFGYVWVDTCCIDKKSSAEVSEAINSMFSWYQQAAVCYAYLDDVHFDNYTEGYRTWKDHFSSSRWFTRGWTLQELLAPRKVVFYAKGWRLLGTKSSLVKVVEKVTRIDELTLLEPKLVHSASIAQRMSWAANRITGRPEDVAYSLLGIFRVNMPILYGEGEEHAFLRLQEEIIKRSDDHSIFAWGLLNPTPSQPTHLLQDTDFDYESLTTTTLPVLASSPAAFASSTYITPSPPSPTHLASAYALTNKGLHITLPLLPNPSNPSNYLAILPCHLPSAPTSRLTIPLTATATPNVFLRSATTNSTNNVVMVSPQEMAKAKLREMYIPNAPGQVPAAAKRENEEVVLVRAGDLWAPGYKVVGVQGREASWDADGGGGVKGVGVVRVSGVPMASVVGRGRGRGGGGLYQIAVVAFWNGHLGTGFVVRVLVDGRGRCWGDFVRGFAGVDEEGIVVEAKRIWETPGSVGVSNPGSERRMLVEVVNPGAEEESGWTPRPGDEVEVSANVTFAEKWEKEYQRTVQAKIERKKKGVIELSLWSMLWEAAPVLHKEELDQPS